MDDQRLTPARFNGEPGVFSDDIFRADMVMRVPIFTGGRITCEIKAAELLQKSITHNLSRARQELVFNISSVFYSILAQERFLESLEFSKETLAKHREKIIELISTKKSSKVDLLRIDVRLSNIEQNIVDAQNTLTIQKLTLVNIMGFDFPPEELVLEGKLTYEQISINLENALDEALKRRPDYLAAKSRLEAQAKLVDANKAQYWPKIYIKGGYGFRADDMGHTEDSGYIAMDVSISLFERGISAKVKEERAKLAAAQERLRKLELQIKLEVQSALLDVSSSSERVMTAEKTIDLAKESLRIELMKHELGKGSITDVLDAQYALLLSETLYYRALADYQTALIRLDLAIGRIQ